MFFGVCHLEQSPIPLTECCEHVYLLRASITEGSNIVACNLNKLWSLFFFFVFV